MSRCWIHLAEFAVIFIPLKLNQFILESKFSSGADLI